MWTLTRKKQQQKQLSCKCGWLNIKCLLLLLFVNWSFISGLKMGLCFFSVVESLWCGRVWKGGMWRNTKEWLTFLLSMRCVLRDGSLTANEWPEWWKMRGAWRQWGREREVKEEDENEDGDVWQCCTLEGANAICTILWVLSLTSRITTVTFSCAQSAGFSAVKLH